MIEHIVEYLSACPVFDGVGINVNYLDGEAPAYSLENLAHHPVMKRYADGGMLCEKRFVLALRKDFGRVCGRNVEVATECEQIENWIADSVSNGYLPQLPTGLKAYSLEVMKSFSVAQTASMDVRYEAELRLVFYSDAAL